MKKDLTIQKLIQNLKIEFGTSLEIVDYWDADLCSIGLKKGNKLIYISTYNYIECDILKYDFDLEVIAKEDLDKIQVVKTGKGVSKIELIKEIRTFLNLN